MSDLLIPQFTLGDRMAKARESAGIGVTEMARKIRRSRTSIANYEHDRTEPPLTVVMAYATITNVPLWWLIDDDSPHSVAVRYGVPSELDLDYPPLAA